MEQKYYIGLDIGTNSVGFAVTDEDYNVLRLKGKKAWGVRLFDEANTAADRRVKRANRRRLDRRKLKIDWLQEIFKPEIDKIDNKFLKRIQFSNLWLEDKEKMDNALTSKDSLFHGIVDGKQYSDKQFFAEYPTIYHLRQELTTTPAKDVRFLYLALHNIIKRRGHFLFEGDFGENNNFKNLFNESLNALSNFSDQEQNNPHLNLISDEDEKAIFDAIKSNKGIRDKKQEFYRIFKVNDKPSKRIIDVLVDGKINTKDMFELEEGEKFSFNDENFETEIYPNLQNELSDEQLIVVDKLKELYSILQLKKILGDNNYICDAMVGIFEKHQEQLKAFKDFIKNFYPTKKFEMFRNPLNDKKFNDNKGYKFINYACYVNSSSLGGKKQVVGLAVESGVKRSKEEFYKYVKSILNEKPEKCEDEVLFEKEKNKFLSLIESDDFLPKQRTKSNAILPNKLYEKEIRKILDVNKQKFTFLNDKDESGLTNYEKILSIFKFRVPYFVGPIGNGENAESKFGWVNKLSDEPLKPWNINKIVNFDDVEENFIKKMINKCTYLKNEDVLPKHSIIYSKYRVLNEINKLKVDGVNISVELKQKFFTEVFKEKKKVCLKDFKEFLRNNGYKDNEEMKEIVISGIDKNFANDFSSYYLLKNILGENFVENNIDDVEDIIKYITVISDKSRLEKRLNKQFKGILSAEQIKGLKALNFADWGRLSKQFLQGIKFVNKETGEITTIIDELWQTNQNLQELIFSGTYTLSEELEKLSDKQLISITYDAVDELYCSPAVKRGVWQAIKVVNEIVDLAGNKPDKIFVEVTRHDDEKGEKGRKLSRKTNLLKQYESKEFLDAVKKQGIELDELISELNYKDDKSMRSEKLYLYFLQLGKCAYSGEPINIADLYDENKYDVDHIIPQSLIKDDSLNNKVLVKQNLNKIKSDNYPIYQHFDWINKMDGFWKMLVEFKLMSPEKYDRLTRKTTITDEELGGFIARQLVETNQANKAVVDLLKNITNLPRDVVYQKAKYVTDFRQEYGILKSRDVNDFHHAKDAYLNIVVGNVLFNRFTDDPKNFYKKDVKNKEKTRNIKKLFAGSVQNFATGKVVWNGEKDIARIKDIVYRNDCLVSNMNFSNENGAFYDETVYKSLKNNPKTEAKISLKGNEKNPLNNVERYGGYNKMATAYFMLVESEDKKHNKIKTIETVPIYAVRKFKNCADKSNKILEYVAQENKLVNAKVLIDKINIQSTIKVENGEYLLAGKTGDRYVLHNANQWHILQKDVEYVRAISKFMELKVQKKADSLKEENNKIVVSPKASEKNKEIALDKTNNQHLYQTLINQLSKNMYKGLALENFPEKLTNLSEKFNGLSVMEQAEVLFNIIKIVYAGANTANLSLLGEGSNVGKIYINKNITGRNIWLVKRSTTGLIEKTVKLWG